MTRGQTAKKLETPAVSDEGSSPDLVDVPAAVMCLQCGQADCVGECAQDITESGVVHIVPWERSMGSWWLRLWSTARLATVEAELFFSRLPDGPVAPALRFAVLAEACAVGSLALLASLVTLAVAPGWVVAVLGDPAARRAVLGCLVLGIPLFSLVLVAAHAAHGFALDLGAVRQGARAQRGRALRFGLYAAGWDLTVGPLGFVVLAVRGGPRHALQVMGLLSGLPTRCSRAFLGQFYRLSAAEQQGALRTSYWAAGMATVVAACALLATLIAMLVL